jgi:hypothetical protein
MANKEKKKMETEKERKTYYGLETQVLGIEFNCYGKNEYDVVVGRTFRHYSNVVWISWQHEPIPNYE